MLLMMPAFAVPCGFVPPPPGEIARPILAHHTGQGELQTRDAFGSFTTVETEHFAVKWGPAYTPVPEHLDALTRDLEEIWDRQVDDLGWPAPAGSESFRVNVYLASTGSTIPQIDFAGGYVWLDDENYPYIALSTDALDGYGPDQTWYDPATLVAHEFNHVLQIRNSAFFDNERYGPFFWEATANWSVPQTLDIEAESEWGKYLLNPHVALDMWALWGNDLMTEARQYDTALFVHFLTEQRGLGHDFIREVWTQSGPEDQALATLDAHLDGGLDDAFTEFAVRYALGDHDLADTYAVGMDTYVEYGFPDNRITDHVPREGSGGWLRPPLDLRPHGHAWNHLTWTAAGPGTARVRFEPNAHGNYETPSELTGFLALRTASGIDYVDLDTEVTVQEGDRLELIVVSTADGAWPGEVFGYRYDFEVNVDIPEPVRPNRGTVSEAACGCRATPDPGLSFLRRRR